MSEATWADLQVLSPRDVVRNTLEASGFGWISDPRLDPIEDLTKLEVLHRPGPGRFSGNPLPAEFASYQFRKLLGHLIRLRGDSLGDLGTVAQHLGQTVETLEQYLAVIEETGWLSRVGENRVFTPTVDNLGHTLEWYVAYLFNHKLHWQATTNVLLEDNKDGDFDVLAVLGTEIAYVECKTGEPDKMSDTDLANFFSRRDFLEPAFALLLVDTNTSVENLTKRLQQVPWRRKYPDGDVAAPSERIHPIENSRGTVLNDGTTVYVGNANSRAANGLLRTLQLTLRDYSTRIRGKMVLGR